MFKYFLIFVGLFFSGVVSAVPVNCVQGTVSGVVICATESATFSVSLVATGLIAMAALMTGVYFIVSIMNK